MTIGELIEALKELDPKGEVWVLVDPVTSKAVSHAMPLNSGKDVILEFSGAYYSNFFDSGL